MSSQARPHAHRPIPRVCGFPWPTLRDPHGQADRPSRRSNGFPRWPRSCSNPWATCFSKPPSVRSSSNAAFAAAMIVQSPGERPCVSSFFLSSLRSCSAVCGQNDLPSRSKASCVRRHARSPGPLDPRFIAVLGSSTCPSLSPSPLEQHPLQPRVPKVKVR